MHLYTQLVKFLCIDPAQRRYAALSRSVRWNGLLGAGEPPPPRKSGDSKQLAFVRRTLWAYQYFGTSADANDGILFPQATWETLLDQLAATA